MPEDRTIVAHEPTPEGMALARKRLGKGLVAERERRKLTQAQCAEIAGVSQAMYSKFERGTAILGYKPLKALAERYGMKMNDLLGYGTTYPSAPQDPEERIEFFRDRNRRIQELDHNIPCPPRA